MESPKLSDKSKRMILMITDAVILATSLWISIVLRYGDLYMDLTAYWWLFLTTSTVGVLSLRKFGLYRAIVRYIGPGSMLPVLQGVTVAAVVVSLTAYLSQLYTFPRSAPVIFWFISVISIGGSRLFVRAYFYGSFNNYLTREPIAIYGAGDTGAQLAIALLNGVKYVPVAFIDDNRELRKSTIHGIRVYDAEHLQRLITDTDIKQIFLAVPSATPTQRKAILDRISELPVQVLTVPGFNELISGAASVAEIREVDIADVLSREAIPADDTLIDASIRNKNVLVTGAGGTIGGELCKIIIRHQPRNLILFDSSEYALFKLDNELQKIKKLENLDSSYVSLLGTVRDEDFLSHILKKFDVQTLYHAAAYKHVHMVEANIIEGVKNNVLGTWSAARAACKQDVEEFVLVSTDKAVRPTNVMGATKRLAELVVQAFADDQNKVSFCMVRFGNVLRSSGSVIPIFEEQIRNGGPVTIRHEEATRFFMTLTEAAELVIQAGAMAKGGELFVLDMGEPVSIQQLAEKMIHLHGHTIKGVDDQQGIEILYTGLKPGEKLHEELVIGKNLTGTGHAKIMQAFEERLSLAEMNSVIDELIVDCEKLDFDAIRQKFETLVTGFQIASTSVDPVKLLVENPPSKTVTPLRKNQGNPD